MEEIEIEALYTLLKLIKDNKTNMNDLYEYKIIFSEFIEIIKKLSKNEVSKRLLFFLNDIILILNDFSNIQNKNNLCYEKQNTIKNINSTTNINENKSISKHAFIEKIKNNIININELNNIFTKFEKDDKIEVLYKSIDIIIDKKDINDNFINLLNEVSDKDIIIDSLNKIINNLDDIILDIPDADKKLLYIINNLKNIENYIKNDIITKINNISSLSEEEN
jgi:hypothetical protein